MFRSASGRAMIALACLAAACSSDDEASAPEPVTFADDIHPVLQAKCGTAGCHDGSSILPGHGAADVQEAYDATQAPGFMDQPLYERILARITSEEADAIMPPPYATPPCMGEVGAPGCISEAELALIQEWVAQGTPL